ncbi:YhdH/YhfP family quinone oxidoreductase [Vulcaniibacterium gelatinicum]|uniref:YhdH/YhfP family quinone oxidoreductase n=1 Tax=Vulcaniibacterium gelatinicum TaxID=2598725 RepID=UPI0011C9408F|nr:YhdH/YhfP family quinone oxidoreductase [Vulcaniibacterium gelatinicum]
MTTIPATFDAFRIHDDAAGYRSGLERLSLDALSPGELVIRAAYSSVNYKDALAGTGKGKILRRFPLVGGIDVAGHVVASTDPRFREGDAVLVTGCGLSETRDGGYSEYVRLEAQWAIPLPAGLDLRESMILGTAGFTAGLALFRMLENRQTPALGPLAVTGATGGVGSLAVDIFSRAGFEVHAISGKAEHAGYLKSLGAREVLGREALATTRPLESARFGGGLDNVGGPMLASLLAQTSPYGNVASAGLAASAELHATVMPFIIRGVSLLGVASAGTAREIRERIWQHLADDWKPRHLDRICTAEVTLAELPTVFDRMLAGGSLGRTLVRL